MAFSMRRFQVMALIGVFSVAFPALASDAGASAKQVRFPPPSSAAGHRLGNQRPEKVLYAFQGGSDGRAPNSLVADETVALYGTTVNGGSTSCECGTVFELARSGSGYSKRILYAFRGGKDGEHPGSLLIGAKGDLYGITSAGGNPDCSGGCGTVFELAGSGSGYTERVLYRFRGGSDGETPDGLIAGKHGDYYGVTEYGGTYGAGTVFELVRNRSRYSETILYSFQGPPTDGANPAGDLVMGAGGALMGTTPNGGPGCTYYDNGCGAVFELTPGASGYTESLIGTFAYADARQPGPLVEDQSGTLFGTTYWGGSGSYCETPIPPDGCGTAYSLTPSGSGYALDVIYDFIGLFDGEHPNSLTMDRSGALYGTAVGGGNIRCQPVYVPYGCGTVFSLTPSGSGYAFKTLYAFQAGNDGKAPTRVIAERGALYGVTSQGGGSPACGSQSSEPNGCGTVFKVSP